MTENPCASIASHNSTDLGLITPTWYLTLHKDETKDTLTALEAAVFYRDYSRPKPDGIPESPGETEERVAQYFGLPHVDKAVEVMLTELTETAAGVAPEPKTTSAPGEGKKDFPTSIPCTVRTLPAPGSRHDRIALRLKARDVGPINRWFSSLPDTPRDQRRLTLRLSLGQLQYVLVNASLWCWGDEGENGLYIELLCDCIRTTDGQLYWRHT